MSNDLVIGAILAFCLLSFGYWLGYSKKTVIPETSVAWKTEKRSLLRELRERTEQVASQDYADRHKIRLQEIGTDIAALDEELGSPTRRRHK